jgi:HSP20 family protein
MLARWEPFGSIRRRGKDVFSELTGMQQEMNRLFDEFFGERRTEAVEGAWLPAVDVSETDTELVIRAELPGLTHDNIELNLQDNVLSLKGEKKQEQKEEKENFHRVERSYGSFSRSFTLPADVKASEIQATFKDGVLVITLPKAEEAKPKKIQITVGS